MRADGADVWFEPILQNAAGCTNVPFPGPHGWNSDRHSREFLRLGRDRRARLDAAELQAGDRLIDADETWAEVIGVEVEAEPLTAFNLTVADFYTYFVAGKDNAKPVWVHNDCYKHNYKDDERVRKRALEDPVIHNFPYSFDDNILASVNRVQKQTVMRSFN